MADSRVVVGKKDIEYDYPDVSSSSLQSSIVLFPLVASILASQPLIQLPSWSTSSSRKSIPYLRALT
jgi:hypothetical protein